jgi:integrase
MYPRVETQQDLRRFFASKLIRAGLSVKVVAELLAEANAAMTWNVSAHLWPDDEDRSRDAAKRGAEACRCAYPARPSWEA